MKATQRPPGGLIALVRLSIRLPLLFASSLIVYGVFLALRPFASLRSGGAARWRYFVFRSWALWTSRVIGLQIRVEGAPPKPPFILVCNHLSYVDVIMLAARLDCVFVAKADIRDWPIVNRMCRSMGTIFIDRTLRRDVVRVNSLVEAVLGQGSGVVIFPEATSTAGREIISFKSSLLETAVQLKVPVDYAALSYRTFPGDPPAGLSVCWWGEVTFPRHVVALLGLSGIQGTLTFGRAPIWADDRKELAAQLRRALADIFVPSTAEETASAVAVEEGR